MSASSRVLVVLGNTAPGGSFGGPIPDIDGIPREGTTDVTALSCGLTPPAPGVLAHIDVAGDPPPALDRVLRLVRIDALYRALSRCPLGRLVNSLGPLDPGRIMWRRVRANRAALDLLHGADVVFAADTAAIKTAWIARRRRWAGAAYFDAQAASLIWAARD